MCKTIADSIIFFSGDKLSEKERFVFPAKNSTEVKKRISKHHYYENLKNDGNGNSSIPTMPTDISHLNVLPLVVKRGPNNKMLDFTLTAKNEMQELSRVLVNVCRITPGGVVVFFPTYSVSQIALKANC